MNPLLKPFEGPFQLPPFSEIKPDHFQPAIEFWIEEARSEVMAIANSNSAPTFANTIEALEQAGEGLDRVSAVLFNLNSAETTSEIQQAAQEVSPLLTEFGNEITQNPILFERVSAVHDQALNDLTTEQQTLLDKTYKRFVRSGAQLSKQKKRTI